MPYIRLPAFAALFADIMQILLFLNVDGVSFLVYVKWFACFLLDHLRFILSDFFVQMLELLCGKQWLGTE